MLKKAVVFYATAFFVFLHKRNARHVGGLRHPNELENSRSDVAEFAVAYAAVFVGSKIFVHNNARHKVGGVRGIWRAIFVYHAVGVAVVCNDYSAVAVG